MGRSVLLSEASHAVAQVGHRALVLLVGEAGTPKALAARMSHRAARLEGPFVRVRCSAAPGLARELFGDAASGARGRFGDAEGGTLFLEAIDALPPELQAGLLQRSKQQASSCTDGTRSRAAVRLVATIERELWPLVEEGQLREELYRRLTAHRVDLPPLREHPGEIAGLAEWLLYLAVRQRGGRARALAPSTLAALAEYSWPGNLRELKRVIEGLLSSSDDRVLSLPPGWPAPRGAPEPCDELAEHDRALILEALRLSNGTLSGPNGAAARLGMTVPTLRFRLRRLGLSRPT